jgi:hypothetical protein
MNVMVGDLACGVMGMIRYDVIRSGLRGTSTVVPHRVSEVFFSDGETDHRKQDSRLVYLSYS